MRRPRGRDIMAACGQLKSASVKQSAAEKKKANWRNAIWAAPKECEGQNNIDNQATINPNNNYGQFTTSWTQQAT